VTSCLFVQTATGESSGTRSRGLARHNSGQAVALACQQEQILSTAEGRKAFLPFGVGLTAIFAAACVSLKLFNEKIGDFIPEDSINPPLLAADNLLMLFLAVSAVVGCAYTVEYYLGMNAALTLRQEDKKPGEEEEQDWEVIRLPKEARELEESERSLALLLTAIACLLPLPFFYAGFNFQELFESKPGASFNKEFQEFVDGAAVIVSATAGAQAAIVFLIGELQFTDAERRVALQAKQAALSELFFAQSCSEFAAMPAKSALTGAFLAGSALFVEVTAFAAALMPWPAVLSTMRQFFSAKLIRQSSEATFLERRVQTTGRKTNRKQDALSSTTRELTRLYDEVVRKDEFTEYIKTSLLDLPVGAQREFKMLNSESRRKVHFVAAEMGMVSQSDGVKRSVIVTNFGGSTQQQGETELSQEILDAIAGNIGRFGNSVALVAARGVPRDELLVPAVAATAAGTIAPFVLGSASTDLLVPLLTGGIGLATVWQERVGKGVVAAAKNKTAGVRLRCSKAESLFGRAMLAMSALPTYLAIATCATTVSVLCFMEEVGPFVRWSTVPLLLVTICVTALTAQRQKGIQFYIKQAVQCVEGRVPPQCWVSGRRWWIVPTAIAVAMPLDLPRRLTIACAVLATEIGIMMSSSFTQLASASFYAARAQRVWARSDAWAQEASTESRALPLNSAVAVINTLLATALIAFDTPLGSLFPVVGFAVCYQALQSRMGASADTEKSQLEAAEIQIIGTEAPPFLERAAATENLTKQDNPSTSNIRYIASRSDMMDDILPNLTAKLKAEGRTVDQLFEALSLGREEVTWETFRQFFQEFESNLTVTQIERLWLVFDKNLDGGISRQELAAILGRDKKRRGFKNMREFKLWIKAGFRKMMKLFDEKKADDYYAASSAQRAVEGVQASLSELRLSVRKNEKEWIRTGAVVGVSTTTALLAPFVLSEVLTEVLLPIIGAVLTVFAVAAEADTRRSIAGSKVWAAELNEIASTQEELLAIGGLYKARLLALTGLAVAVAITCIAVEEPFSFLLVFPQLSFLQTFLQIGLIFFQAGLSAWCVGRLMTVMEWTRRVREKVTATSFSQMDEETPRTWYRGKRRGVGTLKRLVALLAMVPVFVLAVYPFGKHFPKRAVAATAAGALIVASVLYVSEYVTSRAELSQAARMRTFAMSDAFSEAAEQQGAILPLVSAASIAFAGLITFLTEVNPVYASGLTILQAVAWIVASRKAVVAKFESEAALKVNLNSMSPRIDVGQDPIRRIKRMVLN